MKKRTLSILLVLIMCISLLPATVLAFERPTALEAPVISDPVLSYNESGNPVISFTLTNPASVKSILNEMKSAASDDRITIQTYSPDANGGMRWGSVIGSAEARDGIFEFYPTKEAVDVDGNVPFQVRYIYRGDGKQLFYSELSAVIKYGEPAWDNASDWATEELQQADELGLIPDVLKGADLTQDITRAEFAAVCVKVYENLGNTTALPEVNNPFTDTKDVEVLKALRAGITNGIFPTTFEPNQLLNREQAAAMLTRTFKRVTMSEWTLATDAQFPLTYSKPAAFADDKEISGWAKDSVYFMVANNIIKGVGNNNFAPKNITDKQSANGYANATREQALIIAVRMVQNLDA